ncbi:MAG: hypothetical protein IJ564_05655 [Alphaproteobacteria bacterium]|nr:hypothetical protein [Alphaproteobacteria bacterium]
MKKFFFAAIMAVAAFAAAPVNMNAQSKSTDILTAIKAAESDDAMNSSRYYEDEYLASVDLMQGDSVVQSIDVLTETRRINGFSAGIIAGGQLWRGNAAPLGGFTGRFEGKLFDLSLNVLGTYDTFVDESDQAGQKYFSVQFEATAGVNFAHASAGGKRNQQVWTAFIWGGYKLNRNSNKVEFETPEAVNNNRFHVKGSTAMGGLGLRYTRHFWGTGFAAFAEAKAGVGLQYYESGSEERAIANLMIGVTYNFSSWKQKTKTQNVVFGSHDAYEQFKAANARINQMRASGK